MVKFREVKVSREKVYRVVRQIRQLLIYCKVLGFNLPRNILKQVSSAKLIDCPVIQ